MKLGTLYTRPLQDHDAETTSVGEFILEVNVDDALFRNTGDKFGLVKRQFSSYLASACFDTKVPPEYWNAVIEPKVAKAFNFPEKLSFQVR
jgi:hypothetical protein